MGGAPSLPASDGVLRSAAVNALRLVLHASLAGLYGASIVALVLVLANPGLAEAGAGTIVTLLPVLVVYTLAAGLIWPLLYGAVRFFARHALRVPRLSLRYLMAFHVANAAIVLGAAWATLSGSRRVLGPLGTERLAFSCYVLSAAWLCAALVTLVPFLRRLVPLQIAAACLALLALGVVLPLAARRRSAAPPPPGPRPALPSPARRLILLNFDGGDLDDILTLQAHGKLPAFMRLREEGAYGRLGTLTPCEAPVTRSTLVTGRGPFRHGVRGALARRIFGRGPDIDVVPAGLGLDLLLGSVMRVRPLSVRDRTGPALWEIAAEAGGVAVEAGFEVDLDRDVRDGVARPAGEDRGILADFLDPEALRKAEPAAQSPIGDLLQAVERDRAVEEVLDRLGRDRRPGVVALSFPGLDRVAHVFLRYARPEEFGNVTEREIELYGPVLERYYRRIDLVVARVLEAEGEGACLMVTSSHGIDAVPLGRRLLAMAAGGEARSGTHEDGPDGFLFVRAPGVRPGPIEGKGAIVDVVPTALYALGLPIARDLDGAILTAVFTPRYTLEHPVAVIGTYEPGR